MKQRLLTPGPTPVPEETLLEMAQPVIYHRTPEFRQILAEVLEDLQYIFQTKNLVLPLTKLRFKPGNLLLDGRQRGNNGRSVTEPGRPIRSSLGFGHLGGDRFARRARVKSPLIRVRKWSYAWLPCGAHDRTSEPVGRSVFRAER